jgi:hypothetical protein
MVFTNICVHKLYTVPHINIHQQNTYNKRLHVTQQYIITQNANSSKQ